MLFRSGIEILPTGYLLIDGGLPTSVSYMSNTFPIPGDKDDIAACTALAGEMLGLRLIYLDAGSGARFTVSPSMVKSVRRSIQVPLIVGGGIRTPEKAVALCHAGADILVVGNVFETHSSLMPEIASAVKSAMAGDVL